MLRSGVTTEERIQKLCHRLRRQHARNPALLPISAIATFLLISLLLYLLSSPTTATPHHSGATTFLHASVLARQGLSDATGAFQPGITPPNPPQPLSVRALSALRAQLDSRILVHDFEACIIVRRMMSLVGEDRETGRRDGTGEADLDLDSYLVQLRARVDEESNNKQQRVQAQLSQQQPVASREDSQQQQATAGEEEWRNKVMVLQEQVRELQGEVMKAKAAAAAGDNDSEDQGGRAGGADSRQRDNSNSNDNNNRRITFSKIKQPSRSDAASLQQVDPQSAPLVTDSIPDIAQSPEEAIFERQAAQQQAGQAGAITDEQQPPATITPTQQSPLRAAAAAAAPGGTPAASEAEEVVYVAGIQGGARLKDESSEQAEEEKEWGKQKWKRRWRPKEHGKDKKEHDEDD